MVAVESFAISLSLHSESLHHELSQNDPADNFPPGFFCVQECDYHLSNDD